MSLIDRVKHRLMWMYLDVVDPLPGTMRDFAWKVRWRMRNDRNPLFVTIQDKYGVKEYARQKGVRTAETYFVSDEPESIPFDSLPERYFIKASHGCKWNIYCDNKTFYYYGDGEDFIGRRNYASHEISREQVIEYCRSWLGRKYSKRQWAYRHIVPRIMVEEVLEQRGGGELVDYRCFTFNGKVRAIYVDSPTASVHLQRKFVDVNWMELPVNNPKETLHHVLPEKPDTLDEMIAVSEKLSHGLDFIRVDLYDTTRGVILGEMTVYHNGGEPMPTPDKSFNRWLGEQWVLPQIKESGKTIVTHT
ncbi:MAG: ATP-grasp fold amidoligase family protein [Anaerolineales bacterium]